MELPAFAALLAKRETIQILRSRRTHPWTEDPTQIEDLDRAVESQMGPESITISRDMFKAVAAAVRERLSPRGAQVFDLAFLEGLPLDELCARTGMSADAIYTWKSRISRLVRELLIELASPPPGPVAEQLMKGRAGV
jgi:RNA polymerase sigma-70 factor (ECF subfamily)